MCRPKSGGGTSASTRRAHGGGWKSGANCDTRCTYTSHARKSAPLQIRYYYFYYNNHYYYYYYYYYYY